MSKKTTLSATPWGAPQSIDWVRGDHQTREGFGIAFVSTASHGGFYVDPALLSRVPLAWRQVSFNGNAMRGWFEEDCDWAMVALIFKDCFTPEEIALARKIATAWLAPKLYRDAFAGY
jgi:hypothetical protein